MVLEKERKLLPQENVSPGKIGGAPVSSFSFLFPIVKHAATQNKSCAVKRRREGKASGKAYKPCSVTEAVIASELGEGGRVQWLHLSTHWNSGLGPWCAVADDLWTWGLEKLASDITCHFLAV